MRSAIRQLLLYRPRPATPVTPIVGPPTTNLVFAWDPTQRATTLDAVGATAAYGSQIGQILGLDLTTSVATQPTGSARPFMLPRYPGEDAYLHFNGVTGNGAVIPNSPALQITGDLRVECQITPVSFNGTGVQVFVSKYSNAGQRSWYFRKTNAGALSINISSDGTAAAQSTSSPVVPDGTKWIGFTWRASDGRLQYMISSDGVTWTQHGTDVTIVGPLFGGTDPIVLGARTNLGAENFNGRYYQCRIYASLLQVSKRLDVDFRNLAHGTTSFVCGTGQTVTITGTTANPCYLVAGSVAAFDGVDDVLNVVSQYLSAFNAKGTGHVIAYLNDTAIGSLSTRHPSIAFSNGLSAGSARIGISTQVSSAMANVNGSRRLDANNLNDISGANPARTAVLTSRSRWTDGVYEVRRNGILTGTGAAQSSGNTSGTDSLAASIGGQTTLLYPGHIGRIAIYNGPISMDELRAAEAWCAAPYLALEAAPPLTGLVAAIDPSTAEFMRDGSNLPGSYLSQVATVLDGFDYTTTVAANGTAGARPLLLKNDLADERYLHLPGTAGNFASIPSNANLSGHASFTVDCRVAVPDWTPSAQVVLAAKHDTTSNQREWALFLNTNGTLQLSVSVDGSTASGAASTVAPTVTDGAVMWVRAVKSTSTITYFTSTVLNPSDDLTDWTQFGSGVAGPGGAIFTGTSPMVLGGRMVSGVLTQPMSGTYRRFRFYNGANGTGTKVVDINFATQDHGTTAFLASTDQVVTISQSGVNCAYMVAAGVMMFDGVNDFLDFSTAIRSSYTSKTFGFGTGMVHDTTPAVADTHPAWHWSTITNNIVRFTAYARTAATALFQSSGRRLDGDTPVTGSGPAPTRGMTLLSNRADWAAGVSTLRVDGWDVVSGSYSSGGGSTDSTTSAAARIGQTSGSYFPGFMGRMLFYNAPLTTAQQAAAEAWCARPYRAVAAKLPSNYLVASFDPTQLASCLDSTGAAARYLQQVATLKDMLGPTSSIVTQTTGSLRPFMLSRYPGEPRYVHSPGTTGNTITVPHDANMGNFANFSLDIQLSLNSWATGTTQIILGRWDTAVAAGREWRMEVTSTGFLQLLRSSNGTGTSATATSTVAIPAAAGQRIWLRASRSGTDANFYYTFKEDPSDDLTDWIQLGATVAGFGNPLTFVNTGPTTIGGGFPGGTPCAGRIYQARVYRSATGVVVPTFTADFRSQNHGTTSFLTGTGHTVTISSTGANPAFLVGNSVICFDGVDDTMNFDTAIGAATQSRSALSLYGMFFDTAPTNGTPLRHTPIHISTVGSSILRIGVNTARSGVRQYVATARRLDADGILETPSNYSVDAPAVVATDVDYTAGNIRLRVNGVVANTISNASLVGTTENTAPAARVLGGRASSYFPGHIGRFAIYNGPLTDAEKKAVELWCAEPYNITIPLT